MILATKLHIPQPQLRHVHRARLSERLDEGQHHKVTLVSAPAGFGKTTAVGEWVVARGRPSAWLSLDDGDSDPTRFVANMIAALQTIAPDVGRGVLGALRSPQPPPIESILIALLNDIAAIPAPFILVLDDYHVVDAPAVDAATSFLLEHMPPGMQLVITTREDPQLPLARFRARGQLTEVRAADLRFSLTEAAAFLNDAMGLSLSEDDVAALEARTEGWVAGLQLAAISMRGHADASSFIRSFTGSHRFVLDYLVEEVLHQQTDSVQTFLLRTSILDRLCGTLCDAVVGDGSPPGHDTLEYLERSNLFVVPLDNERHWYRYHHLFGELLRQRLHQQVAAVPGPEVMGVAEYYVRASAWFEEQGLEIEAFRYAAATNDIERAERLVEGRGMPLYLRGGLAPVLGWLGSLPVSDLRTSPSLCVTFASALAVAGQMTRVEPQLQAAEAALQAGDQDDAARDLIGRIAGVRALLALLVGDPHQRETIIAQARLALEYLHPDNLRERAATLWKLGLAYQQQGDRDAARSAFSDAISMSEASGNIHITILATTSLAKLHETDTLLHLADETYRRVLRLVGDPAGPVACEAYLGLARIAYEINDLDAAQEYGLESVRLAHQLEIGSFVSSELFLARLQLTRGDVTGAIASLATTEQSVRQRGFVSRMPEVAAAQVRALLQHGELPEAARIAHAHALPMSQARVHLAHGDAAAALAGLRLWREHAEGKGWADERLKAMILQAVAHQANSEPDSALRVLGEALALAEPGGFVRTFIDEGLPMVQLLRQARAAGVRPAYVGRLLEAYGAGGSPQADTPAPIPAAPTQPLVESLSQRELEVLRLVADGLSNREIAERLYLALDTVKGHNRVIFGKLLVQRRTEAVARARELGLL